MCPTLEAELVEIGATLKAPGVLGLDDDQRSPLGAERRVRFATTTMMSAV
jgi:hypothetical protein